MTAASAVASTTSPSLNERATLRCNTSTPVVAAARTIGTASSAGYFSSPRPGMYLKWASRLPTATDTGRMRSAAKPVMPSPGRRCTRPTASAGKPTLPRIVKRTPSSASSRT